MYSTVVLYNQGYNIMTMGVAIKIIRAQTNTYFLFVVIYAWILDTIEKLLSCQNLHSGR